MEIVVDFCQELCEDHCRNHCCTSTTGFSEHPSLRWQPLVVISSSCSFCLWSRRMSLSGLNGLRRWRKHSGGSGSGGQGSFETLFNLIFMGSISIHRCLNLQCWIYRVILTGVVSTGPLLSLGCGVLGVLGTAFTGHVCRQPLWPWHLWGLSLLQPRPFTIPFACCIFLPSSAMWGRRVIIFRVLSERSNQEMTSQRQW